MSRCVSWITLFYCHKNANVTRHTSRDIEKLVTLLGDLIIYSLLVWHVVISLGSSDQQQQSCHQRRKEKEDKGEVSYFENRESRKVVITLQQERKEGENRYRVTAETNHYSFHWTKTSLWERTNGLLDPHRALFSRISKIAESFRGMVLLSRCDIGKRTPN